MFLGHQIYEDLKNLIGAEATRTLAERFNRFHLYLPKPISGPSVKGTVRLKYRVDPSGIFSWSGNTFVRQFFGTMAPTLEELKETLEAEFPGWNIELLPE